MVATINPLNAIKGPANIWVATSGTTEPAQTNAATIADPGAGWTFVGATQAGCTWEDDQKIDDTVADQVIDNIGGRVTDRTITVTLSLLELTPANLQLALNRMGTITVNAGLTVYSPGQPNAGSIPQYSAILVDGWAPQISGGGAARRRAIFRKVMNKGGKVPMTYDPTKDAVVPVTFTCYFVSPTIDPYVWMDQTA